MFPLGTHVIRWNDKEWEQFAQLLADDCPDAGYQDSTDLAGLTLRQLNAASAKMERQRQFAAIGAPRAKLLAAYIRLRSLQPAGENVTMRRAPPPAEPPSPLKLDAENRPLAAPAARVQAKHAPDLFANVVWDRSEWLAIACELDRMYPLARYPDKERLTGLTSEDVAFAQRVLPADRHIRHVKVASFSTLLPGLLDAFRDLKRQRGADAGRAGIELRAKDAAGTGQAGPPPPPAATPAPAPPAPALGPWEAIMAPLANQVLGMLVDRLRPVIAELIDQALNAPAPAPASSTASSTSTVQPAAPAPDPATPAAAAERGVRMRIGVVGNRSNYADDLRREFPSVKFTCIDNVREVESVKNCDCVIVLTKFVSHDIRTVLKRLLPSEAYTPINGCLSDIRRVVTGLLNGQPSAPAHAAHALTH